MGRGVYSPPLVFNLATDDLRMFYRWRCVCLVSLLTVGALRVGAALPHVHVWTRSGNDGNGQPYGTSTTTVTVVGTFLNPDGTWWVRYKVVKEETGVGSAALECSLGGQAYSPINLGTTQRGTYYANTKDGGAGPFAANVASRTLQSQYEKSGGGYLPAITTEIMKPTESSPITQDNADVYTSKPLKMSNPLNKPLVYRLKDPVTGETLYEYTLAPGEELVHTAKRFGPGGAVEEFYLPEGGAYMSLDSDGTSRAYVFAPGTTKEGNVLSSSDFSLNPPAWEAPKVSTSPTTVLQTGASPTATGIEHGTQPVGKQSVNGSGAVVHSTAAGSGGATDVSLREGLGAVVRKLQDVESAIKEGGGGGSVVNLTGVESRLDTSNTKLGTIDENLGKMEGYAKDADDLRKEVKTLWDDRPKTSDMSSSGESARSNIVGIMGSAPGSLGYSIAGGSKPSFEVAMPAAFGGGTFNLNPLDNAGLASVVSWFRAATQWSALVWLGVWVWGQIGEWVRGVSLVPQAKGNAVLGGTGGQATALVAAGLISAAVVSGVTGLLAWSFGDLSIGYIAGAMSTNPTLGMPAGALWMLDQVMPISTIVLCAVARFAYHMFAASLFAGVAAVVRFVVP